MEPVVKIVLGVLFYCCVLRCGLFGFVFLGGSLALFIEGKGFHSYFYYIPNVQFEFVVNITLQHLLNSIIWDSSSSSLIQCML